MVKFIVLGDHQTGKTSIIRRFCYDTYSTHYKPTTGVDFHQKTVLVSGVDYRIQLWDLSGRDKIGGLASSYYRKTLGAVIVCDAEKPLYSNLIKWKQHLDEKNSLPNGNPIPTVLMVNKSDSAGPIDSTKLDAFCVKFGFLGWFETSAKEGSKGITDGVYSLLNAVLSEDRVIVHERAREDEDDITFDMDGGMAAGIVPDVVRNNCTIG
jgi:Ras-related protein Rab-32